MDEENDGPTRKYAGASGAKLSQTPSWVMLGFVLGAVTVASLPPWRTEKPAAKASAAEPAPAAARVAPQEPPRISTIEAVFDEWKAYAVWDYNTAEIALWNGETRAFSDYFEVLRYADRYYFRSLPVLSRRIITRGPALPNCPLQFTETEEQYQTWAATGRTPRPFGDQRPLSAFAPEAPKAATPRIMASDLAPPQAPKLEPLAPSLPPLPAPEPKK
jgi:hypothetical protein